MTELVTLRDGRRVPRSSDEWWFECEARAVCHMPSIAVRREHMRRVEKVRGPLARQALELEVRAIWDAEWRPEIERQRREEMSDEVAQRAATAHPGRE